jgi:thioredoxin
MSTNETKAIHLDTAEFDALVSSSDKPVLVDFGADWCGPCRALSPTVDELAGDFADRATVAKVDIDASPELAARFSVASIPTVIVFRDGEVVERHTGLASKEHLEDLLESSIAAA